MTTKTAEYAKSETAAEDYEPFMVGGETIGEVHWIRTEGAVTKGTKSTWTVTQPFKKLFVISG